MASENQNMPMFSTVLALQFLLPPKPISHFLKRIRLHFISCDDDSAALGKEENRDFLDYAFVARFAEAVVLIAKLPPYYAMLSAELCRSIYHSND